MDSPRPDATRPDATRTDGGPTGDAGSGVGALVAEFHRAFGLPRSTRPTADVPPDLVALRLRLLAEESDELAAAAAAGDLVGVADALADITYVVYGTAVTYGIDLDAVVREVHRANMSKLDAEGRPVVRADGKVLRSDRYVPPDVRSVLEAQAARPAVD